MVALFLTQVESGKLTVTLTMPIYCNLNLICRCQGPDESILNHLNMPDDFQINVTRKSFAMPQVKEIFRFMDLQPEIRLLIYEEVLRIEPACEGLECVCLDERPARWKLVSDDLFQEVDDLQEICYDSSTRDVRYHLPSLFIANKRIYDESYPLFLKDPTIAIPSFRDPDAYVVDIRAQHCKKLVLDSDSTRCPDLTLFPQLEVIQLHICRRICVSVRHRGWPKAAIVKRLRAEWQDSDLIRADGWRKTAPQLTARMLLQSRLSLYCTSCKGVERWRVRRSFNVTGTS